MFVTPVMHRMFEAWARFRARAVLPTSGLIAVALGMMTLAGTLVVLGGVTEDVTRHNGLSSTDPMRLRWFIDHRPHGLVTAARAVSQVGSPVALALIVSVAAVVLWLGDSDCSSRSHRDSRSGSQVSAPPSERSS